MSESQDHLRAPTDEELMSCVRANIDDRAIDELMSRYYAPALAVATRRLSDRDLAKDAVQDAFVKVVRNRSRYREGSAFAPWFHVILRNVCTDKIRKRARRAERERVFSETAYEPKTATASFNDLTAVLPEHERELLSKRYKHGFSFQEMGEQLGCSMDAVKKRTQRALKKLREQMSRFSSGERNTL